MTNEEAIDVLKNDIEICTIQQKQACEMAIKALEQPSEDCISREEVRRILGNEVFELTKLHTVNPEDNPKADAMAYGVNWSLNTLMELPPVTPQTVTEFADKCKECGKIKEDLYEKGFEAGKHYIVEQMCALLEKEGKDEKTE